jgi:Icc protein
MRGFKNIHIVFLYLFLLTGVPGCDPWFSYSPFEARLDDKYHNTTARHLARIAGQNAGDSKPFKVALLSDPHYHFSKLSDALTDINGKGDFDFAIVTGDLTENGLLQEFVFFYDHMAGLNIPYLTVIGNHDYLSNGEIVYGQMFGSYNYSFVYNNVKFVLFDNVKWESQQDPDFNWFENELINDGGYDHVIPLSHIPPYDGQMESHYQHFHQLMVKNNIRVSIHGHKHTFSREETYGDGVEYVTISSPQKRSYTALTITPDAIQIEKVDY